MQRLLVCFCAVFLWSDSLMMIPWGSKHVAMFNVILWYKYLRNSTVHFVALMLCITLTCYNNQSLCRRHENIAYEAPCKAKCNGLVSGHVKVNNRINVSILLSASKIVLCRGDWTLPCTVGLNACVFTGAYPSMYVCMCMCVCVLVLQDSSNCWNKADLHVRLYRS
jgi:hypothetical protein